MDLPLEYLIAGGLALLAIVVLLVILARRTRNVDPDASETSSGQSDWARSRHLRQDSESSSNGDPDQGEKLASPFAEQIEDIIRILLKESPELAGVDVDLGSAPDGSLEIWIDGEMFSSVEDIPDKQVQEVFRNAIARWEAGQL